MKIVYFPIFILKSEEGGGMKSEADSHCFMDNG